MSRFGVYVFRLRKDNPASGITSDDVMVGEVDMSSKAYTGLDVEEACRKRVESELQAKNGLSFYSLDDIIDEQFLEIGSDKNHVDSRLRDYICKHTSARPVKFHYNGGLKNTELLRDTTVNEVVSEAEIFAGKKARARHSYTLRPYQQDIVGKALEILKHSNEVLINLSTRGGKSFLSLELAKKTGTKNILIITPFPSAESSFRDEIERHTDFEGWTFYNKDDVKVDAKYNEDCNCVFLSFQIFDDKVEKEKLTNLLSQVHFGTVIVDETHNTSSSDRSTSILANIPHEKEIHLSGTPYNDLMSGRFTKDNTVTMDFIDLMKWDKENDHLVGFPKLSVNLVSNMAELNEKLVEFAPDAFERDADFSFEKAFGSPSDHTHKKAVAFMRWLFSQSIFTEHKHYLMFVPSVQIARMLPEVLRSIQSEFAVMDLYKEKSADYDVMSSGYEKAINDFEALHDKTIIVTCAKCTTGVTLKRCDAIVMCKRLASAETFVQILFRCMTSYRGKETAALYELDSEACFKVIREVAKVHAELYTPKKSELETYRELLDCVAIESWTGEKMEFTSELAEKFLERVKSIPTYWSVEEYVDFSAVKLSKNDWTALDKVKLNMSDKAKAQFIVAQNEKATGIKGKSYEPRKLEETQETTDGNGSIDKVDVSSEAKRKLEALMANLDWEIILNDIDSFDKLMSFTPDWKIDDADVSDTLTRIFRKILKANERSLRDFVEEYYLVSFENAKNDSDLEMSLVNKLSSLSKVDKRTPEVLVNKMLDKLNVKEYDKDKDGSSYILDPCVGTGSMLYYAHKRRWPKDHLVGTDIEERFVNLLNKLGYKNVFVKNCLDDDYGDFIREKIGSNNFMKIIQNPPYDRNLHLKILNKIVTEFPNSSIVNLSPVRWLQHYNNKTQDFKKYEDSICKHMKSLEVPSRDDMNNIFNIGSYSDIGIYSLGKDGGFDYLNFWKTKYSKADLSLLDKILKSDNIKSHVEKNKRDGIRVLIAFISGNRGHLPVYKDLAYVVDGFKSGVDWTKCKNNGGYEKTEGQPIPMSIEFATENEAQNFYDYCKSDFVNYCSGKFLIDQTIMLELVPYLNDYSHKWTDDGIYNYFGLTVDEINAIDDFCQKKTVNECLDDDYGDFIKNVVEENELKIIMNPPYDRNLHLKILDANVKNFPVSRIVSLQPTRWIEDPLKKYKKSSDFYKFTNITKHLEDIEILPQDSVGKLFNAGLPFNLGVYSLDKKSTFNFSRFESKIVDKIVSKITDTVKDHITIDDLSGISLLISLMTGGRDGGLKQTYVNGFMMEKSKAYYYNCKNEISGKTYYDYRKETAWGNLQPKSENTNIKFNSFEERENFYNSYKTKFLRWYFGKITMDVHVHSDFLPYLEDYTRPWTDEDLYKHFNLTQDEINMIETEMSDKGAE